MDRKKIIKWWMLASMYITFIFSCNSTPNCSDSIIKEKVLSQFKKEIKPILLDSRIEDKLNYSDLRAYANDHQLNYEDILNEQKEKIKAELNDEVELNLQASKILNISTEKIDKEIKKCNCAAEIVNPHLKDIEIRYTVQHVEENKDGIIIKIDYNIKKNKE